MYKAIVLIAAAVLSASGCAASARPYPGSLDARLAAYARTAPCCDDPAGFDYAELPETGTLEFVIGTASPRHFSIMGYILDATELTQITAPELAQALIDDQVDLVLLVPV